MSAAPSPSHDHPDPTPDALIAARPQLTRHPMDGLLFEGVPLAAIAHAVGTPTWVYGAATIRARFRALANALADARLPAHIHFAVKANDHLAVLHVLGHEGAGADVVSAGELLRARAACIPAARIVFSGVGKTQADLRLALDHGIAQINVESAEELAMLSDLAAGMGRVAPVALRVNPDVDAGTHAKISTGRARDKFGIPYAQAAALYAHAGTLPGIAPRGLAMHIGSQIGTLAPFRAAYGRIAGLVRDLRAAGQPVAVVDCGGGLAIPYRDEPVAGPVGLAGAIAAEFGGLDVELLIEPGRWLIGPAGVLLTSVILVKRDGGSRFVVLDAAMNDLVRPAMYDAWHGIVPVGATDLVRALAPADVVGPVCESSDTFARGRALPPLAPGALVAILDAGAYGAVMSSTYNARPLAAEVLVDGAIDDDATLHDGGRARRAAIRWTTIRPRQDVTTLWRDEAVPDWLK
ncbi:MAG: diaminopimelate decarboxylase [Proteobacteria bacterium]|nr:diaminopimelate decarboxylase [Pseudomonadota bacterium]